MSAINYHRRQLRLESEIEKLRLDSFLVTNQTNVSYLSGFRGQDSVLLVTGKKRYFITDSRYLEEAREDVKGFCIQLVRESTYRTITDIVKSDRLKRVG